MFRLCVLALAGMSVIAAASRAADPPADAKPGSIVKVDLGAGLVYVRAGDQEVAVNLKDIQLLRGQFRYRLAPRRAAGKILVVDENGQITELEELKPGSNILYREKDGKIIEFLLPRQK